jgi:hypothetical protein
LLNPDNHALSNQEHSLNPNDHDPALRDSIHKLLALDNHRVYSEGCTSEGEGCDKRPGKHIESE